MSDYISGAVGTCEDHLFSLKCLLAGINEAAEKRRNARIQTEAKLAALREKYRWRKQSEEPAPKDELVIAIRMFPETDSYDFRQARGVWLTDDWYWRPLDLLELERIEGHPIHVN